MSSLTNIREKKRKLELFIKLVKDDWEIIQHLNMYSLDISNIEIQYMHLMSKLKNYNVVLDTDQYYSELTNKYDSISKKLYLLSSKIYQERNNDVYNLLNNNLELYDYILENRGSTKSHIITEDRLLTINNAISNIRNKYDDTIELNEVGECISCLMDVYNELIRTKRELVKIDNKQIGSMR